MARTRILTIGQIFGCASIMWANVAVRFAVSEDGRHTVSNMDEIPFHVQKGIDWEGICDSLDEEYGIRRR